jgi:hypothetical protein
MIMIASSAPKMGATVDERTVVQKRMRVIDSDQHGGALFCGCSAGYQSFRTGDAASLALDSGYP